MFLPKNHLPKEPYDEEYDEERHHCVFLGSHGAGCILVHGLLDENGVDKPGHAKENEQRNKRIKVTQQGHNKGAFWLCHTE